MGRELEKDNLVILKDGVKVPELETTDFKPNKFYRCIIAEHSNVKKYCVYGVIFNEKTFNEVFEFAYDKIMRDFKELGLLKSNGKPITKKLFKEKIDIHTYFGQNSKGLYRGYFMNSNNDIIYSFKSLFRENKKTFIDYVYKLYKELVQGYMSFVDSDIIEFGNCGIPLYYQAKLRSV